jgi:hypothetical protein
MKTFQIAIFLILFSLAYPINADIIYSTNTSSIQNDVFWKQQYLENQKQQQQQLEQQKLELEKQKFKYEQQQILQQKRQERIMQLQQFCNEKTKNPMSSSDQSLCNAVENNIKFGIPLTDQQLGIKMWEPSHY